VQKLIIKLQGRHQDAEEKHRVEKWSKSSTVKQPIMGQEKVWD
jgi:hypothetical protein